jgi:hypothetical protein
MNERGLEISERLAWALDLDIAPVPGASAPRVGAVEAGADRAQWAKEGFSHLAELRDAIHGARPPDSVPESPSERWLAEGQYLELIVASKSQLPPISAWLDTHPDAEGSWFGACLLRPRRRERNAAPVMGTSAPM